jgi:hypothetical protein
MPTPTEYEAFLSEAADKLRRADDQRRDQGEAFKTLVRESHKAGLSIRQIASASGYYSSWIGRIVAGEQ